LAGQLHLLPYIPLEKKCVMFLGMLKTVCIEDWEISTHKQDLKVKTVLWKHWFSAQ